MEMGLLGEASEKATATHTSILPWTGRIPEEFHGLYSPCGRKESDTTEQLSLSLFSLLIGRTDAEAEAPILWPLDVKS